jgi:hypothetical protein
MLPSTMKDIVERVVRTFVVTFVGLYAPVLLGAQSLNQLLDLSVADKAFTAGIVSALTLVLAVVGANVGDLDDSSFLSK